MLAQTEYYIGLAVHVLSNIKKVPGLIPAVGTNIKIRKLATNL
jgi:hypothetical protein